MPSLTTRRSFLRFLAASPLASLGQTPAPAIIGSARDAQNVFDFDAAARHKLPPAQL